LSIIYTVSY